jgi:hypothetical protein
MSDGDLIWAAFLGSLFGRVQVKATGAYCQESAAFSVV